MHWAGAVMQQPLRNTKKVMKIKFDICTDRRTGKAGRVMCPQLKIVRVSSCEKALSRIVMMLVPIQRGKK